MPDPERWQEAGERLRVADELPEVAADFLARAPKLPGSWWSDWDAWLAARSGGLKAAPRALGNRARQARAKAPGTYVLAS